MSKFQESHDVQTPTTLQTTTTSTSTSLPPSKALHIPPNLNGIFTINPSDIHLEKQQMDASFKNEYDTAVEVYGKYSQMIELSKLGDLNTILSLLFSLKSGAPPVFFTIQIFKVGVVKGCLDVPRFMIHNGFDCSICTEPLKDLIFEVIANSTDDKVLESITFLIEECGMDVNTCRKSDCYTPLHVSVHTNNLLLTNLLLSLGGDVNAVGLDMMLPLNLAIKNGGAGIECEMVVKKAGGRVSWRVDAVCSVGNSVKTGEGSMKGWENLNGEGYVKGKDAVAIRELTERLNDVSVKARESNDDEYEWKPKLNWREECEDAGGFSFSCGE